jgi:hypothetical protein
MAETVLIAAAPEPLPTTREWTGAEVPAGHVVATGYVAIQDVVCRVDPSHQLNPAAVERSYREQLASDGAQAWPPPTGHWRDDGRFVLTDGRHRYVASLMLGMTHLLVAWLRPPG